MTIALLATGDELTHGDTLNTNTQPIANRLSALGFSMGMHVVCGDKERELLSAIKFLCETHEALILTGGLGPTSDDRTRFAWARYLNAPLVVHDEAVAHIQKRLDRVDLPFDEGNRNQALFPEGATLLPNPHGTALGAIYQQDQRLFVLLPGPPKECMPMFDTYVVPYIQTRLKPSEKVLLSWRLQGVPEGKTAAMLEEVLAGVPCQTGYRVDKPYLEFKVRCTQAWAARVRDLIDPLVVDFLA